MSEGELRGLKGRMSSAYTSRVEPFDSCMLKISLINIQQIKIIIKDLRLNLGVPLRLQATMGMYSHEGQLSGDVAMLELVRKQGEG